MAAVLSFFMFSIEWELLGPLLVLFFLFIIITIGDRVFLVFIKAKEVDQKYEEIYERLQNLACCAEVKNIKLYKSFYLPANAYILHPYVGPPALIFSMDFFDKASDEVITNVLEKAVLQIKTKRSRFAHVISLFQFCLMSPRYIFEKAGLGILGLVYAFILFPMEYIKDFVVSLSIQNSINMIELDKDTQVAYYLDKFKSNHTNYLVDLGKDFALYQRSEFGLWDVLLNSYGRAVNRYNHERFDERENQ
jgi:ABC-type multidrug transport system fused ATPase/permease subunit